MSPAVIAGLVREQSPDHAPHVQEFISFDGERSTVNAKCSCSVGLTLVVPKTPAPVLAPLKAEKGKVPDGA